MKAYEKVKGARILNRGETGIGTLIIFIAVVIVAAIAAGVLLSTAGSLQQKALSTGKQSQQEVASGLEIVAVSGINGSDGTLEEFEILTKLSAGSDPLSLNDTVIMFDTNDRSQDVVFSANQTTDPTGTYFAVDYLKNGTDHATGYLTTGDIIKIRFASYQSEGIGESQSIRMKIIPKHGMVVPIQFTTPDVINSHRVALYP